MSYSYRPNPASNEVVTLTFAPWLQVRDVRPGHWPDFYIPDSCIPEQFRGLYDIGEKLPEGAWYFLNWIGYYEFKLERMEAAARCSALTGMPYWFNKVTGEVELEMEVGGSVGPRVNELVGLAAVPFSPIPRDSNVWESQEALPVGAGAGAVGVDVPNFSRPLAFRPMSAARTSTAARTRSPVRRERRSRSRSASPSRSYFSLSWSQQEAPQSRSSHMSSSSTSMAFPRPLPRSTDCIFPSPENMELIYHRGGGIGTLLSASRCLMQRSGTERWFLRHQGLGLRRGSEWRGTTRGGEGLFRRFRCFRGRVLELVLELELELVLEMELELELELVMILELVLRMELESMLMMVTM
jgi:hypothetical protein